MDNPVDLAVGVLVDVHLPDLTVRVAVPLIHLAVAGVVDLDQRRSARSIKRLPLLWLAIEVLIQGDAHHLALLERLPLVGIAVAVGVFFEPFKLLVGAVEKLLLERAVAVFVAGHALQGAVGVIQFALVRRARAVGIELGLHRFAVPVGHPVIDALIVIAILLQARQGVRLVVFPLIDLTVAVGIETLHRFRRAYR